MPIKRYFLPLSPNTLVAYWSGHFPHNRKNSTMVLVSFCQQVTGSAGVAIANARPITLAEHVSAAWIPVDAPKRARSAMGMAAASATDASVTLGGWAATVLTTRCPVKCTGEAEGREPMDGGKRLDACSWFLLSRRASFSKVHCQSPPWLSQRENHYHALWLGLMPMTLHFSIVHQYCTGALDTFNASFLEEVGILNPFI